jgi:hypothetical protein
MTSAASSIPVSVDYTSKDFYSIREDLIARVKDRIPEWTGDDASDFGVALIEAFAYLGDLMAYYIDRTANESFIATATQRNSVLNIAQMFGYAPAGYSQGMATLTFTNTSASNVTIPEGTLVSGEVKIGDTVQTVVFTTASDAYIYAQEGINPGTAEVLGLHGRSVVHVADNATSDGELIGTSSGTPNMLFELGETPVINGTIEIYVQEGTEFVKWEGVQHLFDYGPDDLVFSSYTDEDDIVYISFGDGVSGAIPTLYSEIRAKYTIGGGNIGNIKLGTINEIVYVPGLNEAETTAIQSSISVTNSSVGLGGASPESTEQIRFNAPLNLRANNRAVTLQDYADLALGVPTSGNGVSKANATADVWTSVTLYIAPNVDSDDQDPAPGLDSEGNPTVGWLNLQKDVNDFLNGEPETSKLLIGTTLTIAPPTYVDAIISILFEKQRQYTVAEVTANIKRKLLDEYGYSGMFFEQTIPPQHIEATLQRAKGVKNVRVVDLHREGDSGVLTLEGGPGEIFRFQEANVNIGAV